MNTLRIFDSKRPKFERLLEIFSIDYKVFTLTANGDSEAKGSRAALSFGLLHLLIDLKPCTPLS